MPWTRLCPWHPSAKFKTLNMSPKLASEFGTGGSGKVYYQRVWSAHYCTLPESVVCFVNAPETLLPLLEELPAGKALDFALLSAWPCGILSVLCHRLCHRLDHFFSQWVAI